MAQKKPTPILLIDTTATIASGTDPADNYEQYFNRSELVPGGGGATTYQGGTPDAQFSFPNPVTWTWEITMPQDFEQDGGLSQFLWERRGEEITVTIAPKRGGASWAFTAIIPWGLNIGGTIGAVAQSTLSMPLQGEPQPTFPTA